MLICHAQHLSYDLKSHFAHISDGVVSLIGHVLKKGTGNVVNKVSVSLGTLQVHRHRDRGYRVIGEIGKEE